MDLEGEIKGDRIIPKPLPPVTADPLPVPTPLSQRQGQQNQKNAQITTNNFKRRTPVGGKATWSSFSSSFTQHFSVL